MVEEEPIDVSSASRGSSLTGQDGRLLAEDVDGLLTFTTDFCGEVLMLVLFLGGLPGRAYFLTNVLATLRRLRPRDRVDTVRG